MIKIGDINISDWEESLYSIEYRAIKHSISTNFIEDYLF